MRNKKKSLVSKPYLFWFSFFVVLTDWILQFTNRAKGYGVENRGISFGLGGEMYEFLRFVLPGFLLLSLVYLWKRGLLSNLFVMMLLIGGAGNMLPRIAWGYVWDYIRLPYLELWINLSDVLISVSAMSYILVGDDRDTDCLRDG